MTRIAGRLGLPLAALAAGALTALPVACSGGTDGGEDSGRSCGDPQRLDPAHFCDLWRCACPDAAWAGAFEDCKQTCELDGVMTDEMCWFAACSVETGLCDNEEPGDPAILACGRAHGWYDDCDDFNRRCSSAAGCCSSSECVGGRCRPAGLCELLAPCGTPYDCCPGLYCVSGRCSDLCGGVRSGCTTDRDCCDGLCADGTCRIGGTVPVGSSCDDDGECASGNCNVYYGWCTASCEYSNDCDRLDVCIPTSSGAWCTPACDDDADCGHLERRTCEPRLDAWGDVVGTCTSRAPNPSQGIGDVCSSDSQCRSGTCAGANWCTSSCTRNEDCPGHPQLTNDNGFFNYCLRVRSTGLDICFPGCSSDRECDIYGGGLTCIDVGQGIRVCSSG